jgi:ketosteroid isomerase-like protein
MKKALILLCCLLLALLSCDTDTQDQDETEIRDIIYDIAHDFSWNDVEGIMAHVHPDFRHNGIYREELRDLWLQRRAQYELLDCEVTQVDVDGDYAVVHMLMTFTSNTGNLSYPEPETQGDASYFRYDLGAWLLYGNQEWSVDRH